MARIKVTGFDPSLRNWGVAKGYLDTGNLSSLVIDELHTLCAPELKGKQVRQNSKDIHVARYLASEAWSHLQHANVAFAEVPVGSQSARAMASYGICCGVLGALTSSNTTIIEVTPLEVKLAAVGKKTATKEEMIEWAQKLYPNAPWPMYKENGQVMLSAAKAEHMADAIGAIHAGFKSQQFLQLMQLLNQQQ